MAISSDSPTAPVKRPYHSRLRERQAEATRHAILSAARELFRSHGYAGTTLEAIAEVAGISPKTVSAVFGAKRAILAEIVNPEAFGSPAQPLIEAIRATPAPQERLALVARLARQAYEPLVLEFELLRTAHAVAPELPDLARDIEQRRRRNQSRLAAYLDEQGTLRADLSREEATDVLWSLTGYDLYRMLVLECRWRPERYEAWLAQQLSQALLRPPEG